MININTNSTYKEDMDNLRWQVSVGANEAIGESPIDRFVLSAKERSVPQNNKQQISNAPNDSGINKQSNARQQHAPSMTVPSSPVTLESEQSVKLANDCIKGITSLDELKKTVTEFNGLPSLKDTAKNTVFYKGVENPDILCIGLSPYKEDDKNGIPFSGISELLLQRMFKAIDIDDKKQVGFTNNVFWYPPGGRSLTQGECLTGHPFLLKLIEITKPKIIILFGADLCKILLGTKEGIGRLHGKVLSFDKGVFSEKPIQSIVMHSPHYILETPMCKSVVWEDLKKLKNTLNSI